MQATPPRALARPPAGDLVLMGVAVCAVSTSAPLIREAAAPALAIAFWRNGMSIALLAPYTAARHRAEVTALTVREQRLAGLAGVFLAAHFMTWVPSLSFTTVASSVALVATQPVWAALMARVRNEEVPRLAWIGIGLAVSGVVLLTGIDLSISARALFGDALALAGGIFAAAYVTVGADARRTISTTVYTTICYAAAAALLLLVCLASSQPLAGYSTKTWMCLVALTIGPQLLGHSVFNRVLRTTSPTIVSVAILLEIVGATVLARIFFDETPPPAAFPAAALIALGVVLVVLAGRDPAVSGMPVVE